MLKISTHDSCTGELPYWWDLLSWLLFIFARTQSKTINQQIAAGCRMFDLRAKKFMGKMHSGHGGYTTKRKFEDIVSSINNINEPVYASLACEYSLNSDAEIEEFKEYVSYIKQKYNHIQWGQIVIKHINKDAKTLLKMLFTKGPIKMIKYWATVNWIIIQDSDSSYPKLKCNFIALNGINWQTWIPIPWIWKKKYYDKTEFNEDYFIQVDFL